MTVITNDVINNTPNDFNLFVLLRSNMIMGEIQIKNLSSKNRAVLHKVCSKYGLEHYSTGNYSDRVIVIKNKNHTFFDTPDTTTKQDYLFVNKECNMDDDVSCTISSHEQNNLRRPRFVKKPIDYSKMNGSDVDYTNSPFSFLKTKNNYYFNKLINEVDSIKTDDSKQENDEESEEDSEEESEEESEGESEGESDEESDCDNENFDEGFYNMMYELKTELKFVRLLSLVSVGLNIITMYHL